MSLRKKRGVGAEGVDDGDDDVEVDDEDEG